jgi:hypothetical protein
MTSAAQDRGDAGNHGADDTVGDGVFFVNERQARVAAHGEVLTGREILSRVGLSADKYELFEQIGGKAGPEILPDAKRTMKPGDHFRATIRGTDYSAAPTAVRE